MDTKLFNIIAENVKLNIECSCADVTNAMIKVKSRETNRWILGQNVKIDELDENYQNKSRELIQKLIEKKKQYSEYSNQMISSLHKDSKDKKRKIIKEIESASERLRNAQEDIQISKMMIESEIDFPEIDLGTNLYDEKLQEQLQRAKDKIEKMNKKKSQWESTLAELAELEKSYNGNLPIHKKTQNDFQKIINS